MMSWQGDASWGMCQFPMESRSARSTFYASLIIEWQFYGF